MSDKQNLRAREIIKAITYITIATVDEKGEPWNSPVFTAYDQNYNFYWGSHRESQHSKNIAANNNIALVIYDSTVEAGAGEGVYMKAKVKELTDLEEIKSAHKLICDRHTAPYWKLEEFEPNTPIALYKAVPEKVWMNDEGEANGHYIDVRTEVEL